MDSIHKLLQDVRAGAVSIDEAECALRQAPFQDIGFANVDTHRQLRQGATEVIYGEGKTAPQIAEIVRTLQSAGQPHVLITRLDADKADAVVANGIQLEYHSDARVGIVGGRPEASTEGYVLVASAGTSDMPVAEEAALTSEMLGCRTVRAYDVGVAGLHRTLARLDDIMGAAAIVAVAGMEGALASVLGGMANCPVIAVPTSVGYGAAFGGVAALLSMLNSCASGVTVVNIDNGFGAAYTAAMICKG
ncbi:MAG: nickel pincer cofactor biosynthesis protein LarB [Eggerthellaceae bacterium]|nr:nickel pincer cofactor biosynthesis protein LarB [Eggerthellaceae bacterium]